MKKIRTYSSKIILFILAFQILNLSVYGNEYRQVSVDAKGNTSITINQIDCFVEYVVEEIVAHRNVFPEHKGNHTKNEMKIVKAPIQWFAQNNYSKKHTKAAYIVSIYSIFKEHYDYLFFKEINPPPPKIA